MPPYQITLKPTIIARGLGIIMVLLILASLAGQVAAVRLGDDFIYGLVPLFNLDSEQNIPTFFASSLLLIAAILLTIITRLKKKQKAPHVPSWAFLSVGFFYMAADEASSIHELLTKPMRALLGGGNLGIFHFAWVVPGITLVCLLALVFLRFFLHLPPKTRLAFLAAAALYIGGAIGFELIGGRHVELVGRDYLYTLLTTTEESLEMTGAIVLIWALLDYLAVTYEVVRLSFSSK
jgi:hypothetical protein